MLEGGEAAELYMAVGEDLDGPRNAPALNRRRDNGWFVEPFHDGCSSTLCKGTCSEGMGFAWASHELRMGFGLLQRLRLVIADQSYHFRRRTHKLNATRMSKNR